MDDGSGTANGSRGGVTEAAHRGDERTALLGFLQRQRDLVRWKLADAPDHVLRAVSTPTGLTPHNLVQHLTVVERGWLRGVFAGQPDVDTGDAPDESEDDAVGHWHVAADVTVRQLLDDYAAESARCDAVVASAASLDAVSALHGFSLRWILLHLVEETARHLGHLDLLREQADGRVGEEPEEWSVQDT